MCEDAGLPPEAKCFDGESIGSFSEYRNSQPQQAVSHMLMNTVNCLNTANPKLACTHKYEAKGIPAQGCSVLQLNEAVQFTGGMQ